MDLLELRNIIGNIENINLLRESGVSALIVNDYFEGKIMRCKLNNKDYYFNLINNKELDRNVVVDFTLSIFHEMPNYKYVEEINRETLLLDKNIKKKYIIVLNNINENLKLEKTIFKNYKRI